MKLESYWHPLAKSDEVTERPRRFVVLERSVVAYRVAGQVVVLDDLCSHRGAALSLGWLRDGELVCPYHGWRYDQSGVVVNIPALRENQKIPNRARTTAFATAEKSGLVWVAIGDPVAPVPRWPDDEDEDPNYYGVTVGPFDWNAHIGRAVENNFDFTHFPFVHGGILGTEEHAEAPDYEVVTTESGIYYEFSGLVPDLRSAEESVGCDAEPTDFQMLRYQFWLVKPFTVFIRATFADGKSETLGMFHIPVGPRHTRIYNVIYRNFAKDDEQERAAYDEKRVARNILVLAQDQPVIESQRPENIPADITAELHIKPDVSSIVLRRVMAEVDEFNEWPIGVEPAPSVPTNDERLLP